MTGYEVWDAWKKDPKKQFTNENTFYRAHKEAEMDKTLEKNIIDDYLSGLTLAEITEKFNCTHRYAKNVIRRYFNQPAGLTRGTNGKTIKET